MSFFTPAARPGAVAEIGTRTKTSNAASIRPAAAPPERSLRTSHARTGHADMARMAPNTSPSMKGLRTR